MRTERMWRLAAMSLAPGLTACAGGPPIVTASAAECAALIPAEWKAGVPGAQLPAEQSTVGEWIAFADAQTGRLDQANGRTRDSIAIVERCEARERDAVKRAKRRRLFG
jgi:hypothetical protein